MNTTTRAAAALLATILAPALARRARQTHTFILNVEQQQWEFPHCRAAEFAAEEEAQPAFAAMLYAQHDAAWETVTRLYDAAAGQDDVDNAQDNAQEMDKEVRKSIWYWAPRACGCATCQPLTGPALEAALEVPTRWELHGEPGADW